MHNGILKWNKIRDPCILLNWINWLGDLTYLLIDLSDTLWLLRHVSEAAGWLLVNWSALSWGTQRAWVLLSTECKHGHVDNSWRATIMLMASLLLLLYLLLCTTISLGVGIVVGVWLHWAVVAQTLAALWRHSYCRRLYHLNVGSLELRRLVAPFHHFMPACWVCCALLALARLLVY